LAQILDRCYIEREIITANGMVTVRHYGNSSASVRVYQTLQVTKRLRYEDTQIDIDLLDNEITYYRLVSLDIYMLNRLIYSKDADIDEIKRCIHLKSGYLHT